MPQHLTVQGRRIISAPPDQIVIGFELSQMHKDYGKCVSFLNERLEQFYQVVEKASIESSQIKLSNYNIDAKAKQSLRVKINKEKPIPAPQQVHRREGFPIFVA